MHSLVYLFALKMFSVTLRRVQSINWFNYQTASGPLDLVDGAPTTVANISCLSLIIP
jgi:hypothetical protein